MIFTGREALRKTEEAYELKKMKMMGFEGETFQDAIENSTIVEPAKMPSFNKKN